MALSPVIVDKSFLQGHTKADVLEFSKNHRILMTEALLYELLSNPIDRRSCFGKLPATTNPVDIVMHAGGYLKKEIYSRKPAPLPSERTQDFNFEFNARLRANDYRLPPEASAVLQDQHAELLADVRSLKARALHMPDFFPEVFRGSDSERRAARLEAERDIAAKPGKLFDFYASLRAPKGQKKLPPRMLITEDWAVYRWLQIHLLFALDLYCRYGTSIADALTPKVEERIEHDVLDAQYLFIGVLQKSFATHEKKLRRWFQLIHPKGELFGKDA